MAELPWLRPGFKQNTERNLPMVHFRPSHRTSLTIAAVLAAALAYGLLVANPRRQHVIRRYDDFRAVVATGDANRIMQFVAPECREWAASGLHIYGPTFVGPLGHRSTVTVGFSEAAICPRPGFLSLGGHVVKMVEHDGEWFMGRVYID